MLETSARLLQLLTLFQQRRYWPGAELAARLEVTSRTLRRDVDKLRTLGYPVHSTSGVEGGYQLGAGSQMPPLLLDDGEALAVALGLRLASAGTIEGVEEASVRAMAKLEQILPRRLRQRVAAIEGAVVVSDSEGARVPPATLAAVASACREKEALRFRYRDHSGESSTRSVEPYRLVHTLRQWYLVAWDRAREDWRTFRLDRMEHPKPGSRFLPRHPPAEDLAAYVTRGIWNAAPCRARLKLLVPAAQAIARLPPHLGLVEPIDGRSCRFEVTAPSYDNMAANLARLDLDFEVEGPGELSKAVKRLEARYRRATAGWKQSSNG